MVSVAPNHIFGWGLGTDRAIFWKYRHGDGTPWSGWNREGGVWTEDPVIGSRGLGEAAIFLVDTNHALHQANYNFTKDDGVSAFKLLGGELAGPPGVANRKGTLHIFYVGTDHGLYHKAWDGTKYAPEEKFEKIGGGVFHPSPVAVSAGANEVSVFAVGLTDGVLHHHYWRAGSGWHTQGSVLFGTLPIGGLPGQWVGTPSAVSTAEGSWDVFGISPEGAVNHLAFSNGRLANLEVLAEKKLKTVDAISLATGTVEIFGWGLDGHTYHRSWNGKAWGKWEDLGGFVVERPSPVSDAPGALNVVGVGGDRAMYFNARNKDTGTWSNWARLDGILVSRIA